jgi:hypothetical protein
VLSEIPGDAPADFGIGIIPVDGSLVAGIHAGAALDTILYLEVHLAVFIHGIAICRTNIGGTFMRTDGITDIRINFNMGLNIRFGLVAVADKAESFGKFE